MIGLMTLSLSSFAQIKGKVIDQTTKEVLANASITGEKGENITSKIYNELFKNQEKSNKLALNKIKLETDLSKAQSNNNFKAEKSIRIALYQNQLTSNQLDKNDTLLRQLEGIVEEEEKITKEKQK